MVLNKRIFRVLLKQKAIYIGSIVLVMLSSLLYSNLNIAMKNVEKNKDLFLEKTKVEDAKAILQRPIDNIKKLEDKFNISIEARRQFDANISENTTIRVFEKTSKVNIPYIVEGNDIKSMNEILLEPNFAKTNGYNLGDKINILDKEFTIVGFFSMPDYIYPLKSEGDIMINYKIFGTAIISDKAMNEMPIKGTVYYLLKSHSGSLEEIKEYLGENHFIIFWQEINDNPRFSFVNAKLMGSAKMAIALPSMILLLTSLLVAVVLWRMIKTEFTQIGTLYALGYSKKEIGLHYLSFVNIIALTGGIIGTIFGLFLVKPLAEYFTFYFNIPLIDNSFDYKYILGSLLIPYIFIIPTMLIVLFKALRYSPVKLMRGKTENSKVGFIEKSLNLKKLRFPAKFKIREITKSIPRLFVLIFGITLSSMFLLLGFLYRNSIDYLLNQSLNDVFKYEYNYVLKSYETSNIYGGEEYNFSVFKVNGKVESFVVFGIKPNSQFINLIDKNSKPISEDNVIITKPLAKTLKVKEGDTIVITNKYNNDNYTIKIDKIAEIYTGNNIYMPLYKLNNLLGFDSNSFIGIFSKEKLNIPEEKILKFETKNDIKEAFKAIINPLKVSLGLVSFIAFFIALIVIYVVTGLSIEENKTNISMFKILGYTHREINDLILNTFTIPIIIGFVLSIPLLIKSMDTLLNSLAQNIDFTFPLKLNTVSIILGFLILYITFEVSKYFSKKNIFKIPMSEALKTQRE
ncbi:ABC transporter permease [Caloramator australicus]|uniref:ABC-type antimicrobial peptide transport system,permease component n=1 Tax=Caloramator australicus RC3 TaxID=857293 RepID=I7KVF6_9CLOT|nr:FtsX-like permease family protein [Caloramator australicus]CCJ33999.1 ABC-type antimicrobial peptide transport system,permease component [Caloramator australicus RC3]